MNVDPRLNAVTRARLHKKAAPQKAAHDTAKTLETLLLLEGEARAVEGEKALHHFIVNETKRLVPYGQAVFFTRALTRRGFKAVAASSLSRIDPNAPTVHASEALVNGVMANKDASEDPNAPVMLDFSQSKRIEGLPFDYAMLVPVTGRSDAQAGVLMLLRDTPFEPAHKVVLARVATAYGHSLAFYEARRHRVQTAMRSRRFWLIGAALAALAMLIPVPMSALAPAEIVASSPLVITAPLDGVIDEIAIAPNSAVQAGDLLVKFNDIDLSARLKIAERGLDVAEARFRRATQGAAASPEMRRELLVSRAERDLAQAELDEAQALLARSQIRANAPGLAVFSSREEWVGRPVTTGERIMEIADPTSMEIEVQVAMGDSIVLDKAASVRMFPNHDPFNAFSAKLIRIPFRAESVEAGRMVYLARAGINENARDLRIGQRGTVRIAHGNVMLGYYLFRRPIATFRQWTGI